MPMVERGNILSRDVETVSGLSWTLHERFTSIFQHHFENKRNVNCEVMKYNLGDSNNLRDQFAQDSLTHFEDFITCGNLRFAMSAESDDSCPQLSDKCTMARW